jgi:hypothetical protein
MIHPMRRPCEGRGQIGQTAPMPVVVTGADSPLGAAVVAAFLAAAPAGEQVELRATVRDRSAAAPLVAAGVRTAVSGLDDPLRLGAVFEAAHTVVHLDDPAGTWDLLLEAAEDTGVRRLLTVLPPGAPEPEAGPYELVVLRPAEGTPERTVAAALVAADRRALGRGAAASPLRVPDVDLPSAPTGTVPTKP